MSHHSLPAAGPPSRDTGAVMGRKRTFLGTTPRCGKCKTCDNRALKKACLTNRRVVELFIRQKEIFVHQLIISAGRGWSRV